MTTNYADVQRFEKTRRPNELSPFKVYSDLTVSSNASSSCFLTIDFCVRLLPPRNDDLLEPTRGTNFTISDGSFFGLPTKLSGISCFISSSYCGLVLNSWKLAWLSHLPNSCDVNKHENNQYDTVNTHEHDHYPVQGSETHLAVKK